MPSQSSWPIVFGITSIVLVAIVSISALQKEEQWKQDSLEKIAAVNQQKSLIDFASQVEASELKTAAYTLNQQSPFRLPSSQLSVYSDDPVITQASSPNLIQSLQPIERIYPSNNEHQVPDQPRIDEALENVSYEESWNTEEETPDELQTLSDELESQLRASELATEERVVKSLESILEDYARQSNQQPEPDVLELPPVVESVIPKRPEMIESDILEFAAEDSTNSTVEQTPTVPTQLISTELPSTIPETIETPIEFERQFSEVRTRIQTWSQPIRELPIREWFPDAAWPKPVALVNELEHLTEFPAVENWSGEMLQLVKLLHWSPSLSDNRNEVVFQQMISKLNELNEITIEVSTVKVNDVRYVQGQLATELRSLYYDFAKRLMIWQNVHQLAKDTQSRLTDFDGTNVKRMIQASNARLSIPNVESGWGDYLSLGNLEATFNSLKPDFELQKDAARTTLARYYSHALTNNQRQFLDQNFGEELLDLLKAKAVDELNLTRFLTMLERHEYSPNGYTSAQLNNDYQSLLWSADENAQQLAFQMEGHYRNANFRVSVSENFINRLVPQQPEMQQPVHDQILGAQVDGSSRVSSRIFIRLIPDLRRINLRLEANGRVRSLTQARRGGFTVDNDGTARYQVLKRLSISRNGVETSIPEAYSESNNRVIGMRSNLDPIPIVGWVARQIAQNKLAESKPLSDRLTQQKIESQAKEIIENEVRSQLDQVETYLFTNLLQPLIALELEPTPIEMRTTEERVIMRYRLAGRDQMASHTARPRALADSLMSMQFHESSINNLLDRVEIKGRKFSAQELTQHLQDVFRSEQAAGSGEVNHEAQFEFAPYDPLRVSFKDNEVELQLNLKRFQIGKGKVYKNLNVKATYTPHADGVSLKLVQTDKGINLGTKLKFRDQVAIRAVFTALFQKEYEMNVLPESFAEQFNSELWISQLVVADGWLGLSLADAYRTAAVQE